MAAKKAARTPVKRRSRATRLPARTVLGIDPGSRNLGWAVVKDGLAGKFLLLGRGHAKLPSDPGAGLLVLEALMEELLETYQPDQISIEHVFFNRNISSALKLAEVRGVVRLKAAGAQVPLQHFTPQQAKKAVTGKGRAEKDQVERGLKKFLGVHEWPADHVSDAAALALTILLLEPEEEPSS